MNGCALLFNGDKQSVLIKSLTPDSKIYVDGNNDAVSMKLKRNQGP
ncbi:MAG: hypothetical protein Nk1A_4620 [Endomicrobiia bacterium]|nr:MAG: hypothetical protein Nk1A_4620 [Endomicrobiia bacterium]